MTAPCVFELKILLFNPAPEKNKAVPSHTKGNGCEMLSCKKEIKKKGGVKTPLNFGHTSASNKYTLAKQTPAVNKNY